MPSTMERQVMMVRNNTLDNFHHYYLDTYYYCHCLNNIVRLDIMWRCHTRSSFRHSFAISINCSSIFICLNSSFTYLSSLSRFLFVTLSITTFIVFSICFLCVSFFFFLFKSLFTLHFFCSILSSFSTHDVQ